MLLHLGTAVVARCWRTVLLLLFIANQAVSAFKDSWSGRAVIVNVFLVAQLSSLLVQTSKSVKTTRRVLFIEFLEIETTDDRHTER